jgi:hypothetical protein
LPFFLSLIFPQRSLIKSRRSLIGNISAFMGLYF